MQKFLNVADTVSEITGKLFAWCVVILTGVVCYEVFMRYVLRQPTGWAYDASYILYGSMFFMAGAYALSRNAHVRADVLYRFMKPRHQAALDIVLYVMFFFPAVIMIVHAGFGFARMSWMMNEHSSFSPHGPPLYHFKSIIPISGALLLFQGLAEVTRCIMCLRNGYWPARKGDVEEIEALAAAGVIPETIESQIKPIDPSLKAGTSTGTGEQR
jgi:TRAP-type mannitol/chloroaromatic compound transport system permease small subunit